jgi:hypothetical protein
MFKATFLGIQNLSFRVYVSLEANVTISIMIFDGGCVLDGPGFVLRHTATLIANIESGICSRGGKIKVTYF